MQSIERRTLLAASAASIGATAPATAAEAIVFTEYWAAKQRDGAGIRLAMYRKRSAKQHAPCCSWCMARPTPPARASTSRFPVEPTIR